MFFFNLFFYFLGLHLCLTQIGHNHKHKDIFTLVIFGKQIVILNSAKAVEEVICGKQAIKSAARPYSFILLLATWNLRDLVFAPTDARWMQVRSAFHRFFSDMKRRNDGKSLTETVFFNEWQGNKIIFNIEIFNLKL